MKQLSKCAGTPCQTLEYDRQCPTITIAESSLSLKTYNKSANKIPQEKLDKIQTSERKAQLKNNLQQ